MSNLGLETMTEAPAVQKKKRWNAAITAVLGLLILAFVWIVVSNTYLLYTGKPIIQH
jgi:hypothetical protein